MRLYPPVPRFDREAVAADMLGEHEIRPGDLVSIWPWIIQRHRKLWDNPDAFDPDRFAPGAETTSGIASNICRSAPGRAPASARASRWPRR